MELEITTTPRETLVWAPTADAARALRHELTESGYLVLDADPWELNQHSLIPEGEHLEFDPTRILNVEIGAEANATLHALSDAGHSLIWHPWQPKPGRKVWGVAVSVRRGRRADTSSGTRTSTVESAVHFGIPVRGSRQLSLRVKRDTYARINKRSSMNRWTREKDPHSWDLLDDIYEDAEHRIYTDAWCAQQHEEALANFDLNMAHFASLDPGEFESALQHAVAGRPRLVEVTDLSKWDGVGGLYVMVLDEYRQAYVGATDSSVGIMKRIKQHWTGTKSFDRLIWGDAQSSILSIDSFRALDTTRIFAAKTPRSFDGENRLIERFPPQFVLNRIRGGRDATRFAALLGLEKVMKTREFEGTRAITPSDVLPEPD